MNGIKMDDTVTVADDNKPRTWKDGLRLVDLYELARQMHCKTCASLLDLNNTQSETRWGLASVLSVLCGFCHTLNDICTGKAKENGGKMMFEVNRKASVNMLLCGTAGQHVIHFLAVMEVPQPPRLPDHAILLPPSHHLPSVSSASQESSSNLATPLSTGQGVRETTFQGSAQDCSAGPQVRVVDRIKQERCEEPVVTARNQATNAATICGGVETGGEGEGGKTGRGEGEGGKTGRGKKRRAEWGEGTGTKAVSSSPQCKEVRTVGTEQQEEKGSRELSASVDPERYKEEGSGAHHQGAPPLLRPKRYRCPLCAKVLPSSRGFHIHMGRKHQAPNLQAVHHEVSGADDDSDSVHLGQKKSGGEDTSLRNPTSDPCPSSAATSRLSTSLTPAQRDSATGPGPGRASTSSPSEGQGSSSSTSGSQPPEESGPRDAATEAEDCCEPDAAVSPQRPSKRWKAAHKTEEVGGSNTECRMGSCKKTFPTEAAYQRHLQKTHGVASSFSCVQCGKQYRSQKSLNIHMTVTHCSEDERRAVCKYCGDTMQHRRALKKHIKALHPRGSKRTFYCDECPATFPQPGALRTHKLRHAGIKNYQCFYCDKRFSGSGNRLNHMRYFHEKERKFLCDTCGAGFYRAYALREHERVHSGEKPYQCERCAERFTKKEYLTIHMRTHTGEKPYKCELCDKAFTQRTSRSLHRRKVHGLKKQEAPGSQTQKQIVIDNKLIFVNA